jgi:hypothetical protein
MRSVYLLTESKRAVRLDTYQHNIPLRELIQQEFFPQSKNTEKTLSNR